MPKTIDPIVNLFSRKEEATIASGMTASNAREMLGHMGFTPDRIYARGKP